MARSAHRQTIRPTHCCLWFTHRCFMHDAGRTTNELVYSLAIQKRILKFKEICVIWPLSRKCRLKKILFEYSVQTGDRLMEQVRQSIIVRNKDSHQNIVPANDCKCPSKWSRIPPSKKSGKFSFHHVVRINSERCLNMYAIFIHSIPNDFHWHGAKPLILHFDAFTYALSCRDDIFQWKWKKCLM